MKTAIIICSYNMPEYTDALVEHIRLTVKLSYDLIVFDNGSDLVPPSEHTTHSVENNIQMVPGFMRALECAESEDDYYAYWLLTTSCRFNPENLEDPLSFLLPVISEYNAFSVQPSLVINHGAWKDSGAWKDYLAPRHPFGKRQVWGLEPVCPLYRAEHFNKLGRWNEKLTYGWGFAGDMHWKARNARLPIFTHDGYWMFKDTAVGYEMNRMHMTYKERANLASLQARDVLTPIYGEDYNERLSHEFTTYNPDTREWVCDY